MQFLSRLLHSWIVVYNRRVHVSLLWRPTRVQDTDITLSIVIISRSNVSTVLGQSATSPRDFLSRVIHTSHWKADMLQITTSVISLSDHLIAGQYEVLCELYRVSSVTPLMCIDDISEDAAREPRCRDKHKGNSVRKTTIALISQFAVV
jgi:hypothetical protein